MLCGTDSSEVSMSGHLAAAWGYYDPDKNAFDAAGMAAAGIPAKLIPKRVARYKHSSTGSSWVRFCRQ